MMATAPRPAVARRPTSRSRVPPPRLRASPASGGTPPQNAELDELDRLHRERAIAERLARFKAS